MSPAPGMRFGAGWLLKRVHGDALVADLQYLQFLRASRRSKDHGIARAGFHQRAREGRLPADVVAVKIDLVESDNARGALCSGAVDVADRRAEEDLPRRLANPWGLRVYDLGRVDALRQKPNPPIDLPQPPLVVLVVGVLAAVAVARRPRDDTRHGRAFPVQEESLFVLEALQPAGRDVVADLRGARVFPSVRFSEGPLAHASDSITTSPPRLLEPSRRSDASILRLDSAP